MKIVDRKTFLTMPAGTVYAKWGEQPEDGSYVDLTYEEVEIKGDTVAGSDWYAQDFLPWPEDCHNSERWSEVMRAAINGEETAPLDFDHCGRDGLFDDRQLFAVFSKVEVERLIDRLHRALEQGYAP